MAEMNEDLYEKLQNLKFSLDEGLELSDEELLLVSTIEKSEELVLEKSQEHEKHKKERLEGLKIALNEDKLDEFFSEMKYLELCVLFKDLGFRNKDIELTESDNKVYHSLSKAMKRYEDFMDKKAQEQGFVNRRHRILVGALENATSEQTEMIQQLISEEILPSKNSSTKKH